MATELRNDETACEDCGGDGGRWEGGNAWMGRFWADCDQCAGTGVEGGSDLEIEFEIEYDGSGLRRIRV
jgi:hypothetical protein